MKIHKMTHKRLLLVTLGSFALASVALMSMGSGASLQAQSLIAHDSAAPISYAADHFELQQRRDRAIFWGNVCVEQAGLVMTADRLTVAYSSDQNTKINRIDISGAVTLRKGSDRARADVAVYDLEQQRIVMTGNVELQQSRGNLSGGRLVIDLNKGRVSIDGQGAGRGADGRVLRDGENQEGRVHGNLLPVSQNTNADSDSDSDPNRDR